MRRTGGASGAVVSDRPHADPPKRGYSALQGKPAAQYEAHEREPQFLRAGSLRSDVVEGGGDRAEPEQTATCDCCDVLREELEAERARHLGTKASLARVIKSLAPVLKAKRTPPIPAQAAPVQAPAEHIPPQDDHQEEDEEEIIAVKRLPPKRLRPDCPPAGEASRDASPQPPAPVERRPANSGRLIPLDAAPTRSVRSAHSHNSSDKENREVAVDRAGPRRSEQAQCKYVEVVRKKADRELLPGRECDACEKVMMSSIDMGTN
eukprot:tig00021234_g19398.t1